MEERLLGSTMLVQVSHEADVRLGRQPAKAGWQEGPFHSSATWMVTWREGLSSSPRSHVSCVLMTRQRLQPARVIQERTRQKPP